MDGEAFLASQNKIAIMKKISYFQSFKLNDLDDLKSDYSLDMIWINPGSCLIGEVVTPQEESSYSDIHDDKLINKQFNARIKHGFWFSKNKITIRDWFTLSNNKEALPKYKGKLDLPKNHLSFLEALGFCEKLNEKYKNYLPENYRFSLPTEIQWEYACRAGDKHLRPEFPNLNANSWDEIAWHNENSNDKLQPIGSKKPNNWGLEEMIGNCFEWCIDYFNEYPKVETSDWIGTKPHEYRILRGSAYWLALEEEFFNYSYRFYDFENSTDDGRGLRLALRKVIAK